MDNRVILDLMASAADGPGPDWRGPETPAGLELRRDGPVRRTARVSVIIPTFFNRALKHGSLVRVLDGVSQAASVAEVLLVASDGEESEREHLRGLMGGAARIVEAPPHNRARSRNLGVSAATGEYVIFLDDDMLPVSWRLVDVILSRMLEDGFEGALFPARQYLRFPALFDPGFLDWKIWEWRAGRLAGDPFFLDPAARRGRDLPMYFCFPGCFTLFRREAYDRLGGFDERYVGWGFEDTDFALRAARELRVMNLYGRSEPFLHIDHAVSPYKSEEHRENARLFFTGAGRIDVTSLCRRVFTGRDFTAEAAPLLERKPHLEPYAALAALGVPLRVEEIEPWCDGVAAELMRRFSSTVPEFIVLHGSRASGDPGPGADFDLLSLHAGPVQDFFVTSAEPRVEVECVSLQVFETLAAGHVAFDHRAVFELSKVAQGRLLHGDPARWEAWRRRILDGVVPAARCFWIVLGLGMRLGQAKYGPVAGRYLSSLARVLVAAGLPEVAAPLRSPGLDRLGDAAAGELAVAVPDWRRRLAGGEPIFEMQVPEVWAALHWLSDRARRASGRMHTYAGSESSPGGGTQAL